MTPETFKLEDVLTRARRSIPDCVAIGCVDTRLGLLLFADRRAGAPAEALDMVTSAMGELFRSSNAQAIDDVFRRLSGEPPGGEPSLQQVFALSSTHIYVYQTLSSSPELVLVTVCTANANLGMVVARSRAALLELAPARPSADGLGA